MALVARLAPRCTTQESQSQDQVQSADPAPGGGVRPAAAGQIPAQQQKAEPPEEELLEQGVHKGDVEGDPEEIFPAYPGAGSEGGGKAGEIEDAPGEEEAAENDSEYAGADAASPSETLPGTGEQRAQGYFGLTAPPEGQSQEEGELHQTFDGIAGLDHPVHHCHDCASEQQDRQNTPGLFHAILPFLRLSGSIIAPVPAVRQDSKEAQTGIFSPKTGQMP